MSKLKVTIKQDDIELMTIEDTFLENSFQPIYRVRRDGLMVACIHYGTNNVSRTMALAIARMVKKAVSR